MHKDSAVMPGLKSGGDADAFSLPASSLVVQQVPTKTSGMTFQKLALWADEYILKVRLMSSVVAEAKSQSVLRSLLFMHADPTRQRVEEEHWSHPSTSLHPMAIPSREIFRIRSWKRSVPVKARRGLQSKLMTSETFKGIETILLVASTLDIFRRLARSIQRILCASQSGHRRSSLRSCRVTRRYGFWIRRRRGEQTRHRVYSVGEKVYFSQRDVADVFERGLWQEGMYRAASISVPKTHIFLL